MFLVPEGRRFVWPAAKVGARRYAAFIGVTLEVVALSPRLFRAIGLLRAREADALRDDALALDDDEHRLMRSSTGSAGYHDASSVLASDNAWVQHTPTAERLKQRTFELLGFTHYDENCADGLQVLRYNATQAYIEHVDYLDASRDVDAAALDPSKPGGANRFATVFFYLSDVAQGGETHFPKARVEYGDSTATDTDPGTGDDDDVDDDAALFDDVGDDAAWERRLAASCRDGRRNRARSVDRARSVAGGSAAESVRARRGGVALAPVKDGALLSYSQTPDGALDAASKHGGCPVIDGLKWQARLWVWNAPIPSTSSQLGPADAASATPPPGAAPPAATTATFANVDVDFDRAESEEIALFFEPEDGSTPLRIGELKCCGVTPPLGLSSFVGHTFTARQAPRNHGGDASELARASRVLRRWVVAAPTPPLGGTADTTTTGSEDEPNAFRLRLIDLDNTRQASAT